MSLANVNIGHAPDDHTGDTLRAAFNTINHNFANLAAINGNANVVVYAAGNANVTATYTPGVETVAGRKGNVILTVTDVIGAVTAGQAAAYSPANSSHWNPAPTTVAAALDQLSARIWAIEHP
jgi:hypothetical protein